MIWKTAWKNVWRNKVRSLVVIASVMVGIFAGVFSIALMNGMIRQRISNALEEEFPHLQVSAGGFSINEDPRLVIDNLPRVISEIGSTPGIVAIAPRIIINGMANSATKSIGVKIIGIDPDKENKVFSLDQKIIPGTGDYFKTDQKYPSAFIGSELAKELNIIRFFIDSAVIKRLSTKGVPASITIKLKELAGNRFPNEKVFNSKLKSVFTTSEEKKYGQLIKAAAWSFRKDAKLILTFLDMNDNQVSSVFRITALYDIPNTLFEKSMVFVKRTDLAGLSGFPDSAIHQLSIRIMDPEKPEALTETITKKLPGLEVTNWKKLSPELAMLTDMVEQFYLVFGIIILAALAFGIINTMLMVVLERTRELGMLTAIGMNKRKVFSLIMLESVFLSLTGAIAGMFISWITVILTARSGIDLSRYAEGFEAIGYSAVIYPDIGPAFFVAVTALVIMTGILSSIYPALKALRLNPVEAIRTE